MTAGPQVHVAVGVVMDSNQRVLIAWRDESRHQGGVWEFPGGKVEAGESVESALARELLEEIGLSVHACHPFTVIEHDYGDKQVLLDVWIVENFSGEPRGVEGQSLRWVEITGLPSLVFPPANKPIIDKLISETVMQSPD